MEQFQKEKEELDKGCRECKRKLAECQRKLKELEVAEAEGGRAEVARLQAEAQQLRNEERGWENKLEELKKKEKNMPWNVDTLSKDGFSKSVFNVKPEEKEETEEQKEKKHKSFVERYEKQIKHFGMLRRWDDSQKYLSDNPHLVCEETANYLVIWCIDLEVEEKHALMEQVAHQTIVMQFILELAKSLKVDPRACFRQFFTKIKTADQQYMEGFTEELEAFKERVRGRAKVRVERALREYEEQERQKRLGPGGLDPVEVYESLPPELQKCFDVKDVQLLQDTISKMDPTVRTGRIFGAAAPFLIILIHFSLFLTPFPPPPNRRPSTTCSAASTPGSGSPTPRGGTKAGRGPRPSTRRSRRRPQKRAGPRARGRREGGSLFLPPPPSSSSLLAATPPSDHAPITQDHAHMLRPRPLTTGHAPSCGARPRPRGSGGWAWPRGAGWPIATRVSWGPMGGGVSAGPTEPEPRPGRRGAGPGPGPEAELGPEAEPGRGRCVRGLGGV
uniref:Hsp90 co-chaperone Cdc37 n=1 Tax=Anas zonorhyncha TaxID=75864 RepID=A0A8B9W237_9AVES